MQLSIDTGRRDMIRLALSKGKQTIDKLAIPATYDQAEKLLVNIDKIIKKNNIEPEQIKNIKVKETGDSFSALRIGIVTANALAYALGKRINKHNDKINIIKPKYGKAPNITKKKPKIV